MSERANAHNEKRKARFVAAGIGVADIKYAFTDFVGEGGGSCSLCDHPIENLFSLEFRRPEGEPVIFEPVGSVCITDWIKALPDSPEREAALARIKDAEKRMREVKSARKAAVERAEAEKTAIATLQNPEDKRVMERYERLPLDKRTNVIEDIAKSVLRYGSFKSEKQRGFFSVRLKEAGAGSDRLPAARPATPANASPRQETPARPAPSPVAAPALVPACPNCQGPTVARTSARGPFFGCADFPRCKSVIPIFVPKGQGTLPFPPAPTPEAVQRARVARTEAARPMSTERRAEIEASERDPGDAAEIEAEIAREREAEREYLNHYGNEPEDSGAPF